MGSGDKLGERTMKTLQVVQPGQITIFTIQGVPDIAHPDYTTSQEAFIQHPDFMKTHQFGVIALKDLQKYL